MVGICPHPYKKGEWKTYWVWPEKQKYSESLVATTFFPLPFPQNGYQFIPTNMYFKFYFNHGMMDEFQSAKYFTFDVYRCQIQSILLYSKVWSLRNICFIKHYLYHSAFLMHIWQVVWTETRYVSIEPYVSLTAVTNARNGMDLIQCTCSIQATVR